MPAWIDVIKGAKPYITLGALRFSKSERDELGRNCELGAVIESESFARIGGHVP
jgi:hypothetical protein